MIKHILGAAVSLLMALVITGTTLGTEIQVGVVGNEGVRLRSEPRADSDVMGEMKFGEVVLLLGRGEEDAVGWHRVERGDGQAGWLFDSVLMDDLTGTIAGNRVRLRKGPGLAYGVATIVDRNTPVVILERSDVPTPAPQEFPWFKVALGKRQGWVYGKYLHLSLEDAAAVATSRFLGWRSWKSYGRDSTGRLRSSLVAFRKAVASDLRSAFNGSEDGERLTVHTLLAASDQYVAEGRYDDAVSTLRQALSDHPATQLTIGEMDGIVRCRVGMILSRKLRDYDAAIEEYHKVIAHHPASSIRGTGWNTTSDIHATDSIVSICRNELHDLQRLLTECERIIEESNYDVVQAMAHVEIASVLRAKRDYQGAIEHYNEVIERYPAAKMRFSRSAVHVAADALDRLIDLYTTTLADFDAALQACEAVLRENNDPDLAAFAQYATGKVRDAWTSSIDEVAAEYSTVPDFKLTLSEGWKDASKRTAEARLYELSWASENLAEKKRATIIGSQVRLRESYHRNSKVIRVCRRGENVLPLYPSPEKDTVGNYEDYWFKVQTLHGTIGWIYGQFLSFHDTSQESHTSTP